MKWRELILVSLVLNVACNKNDEQIRIKETATVKQEEQAKFDPRLGLPPVEHPKDNPTSKEKVLLGERLFNDTRFSKTGEVACATCHAPDKAFTDRLKVSEGIEKKTGTRNAPTVINSAYNTTQFWDGRSPSLEDQARHPFLNSVEMGLATHEPILQIVRTDPEYVEAFKKVFNKSGKDIKIDHVLKAIGAFERTIVHGNSRFDQWYFKGANTLSEQEIRGFNTFIGNGRCVSCHQIEQSMGLFMDNKFHNIGVGINRVPSTDVDRIASEFLKANYNREEVDEKVLRDKKTSEMGRFAVTQNVSEIGAFKTPTLRNVDLTAPYMHDGSLKTLEEVVEHYDRGGASSDKEIITPFLSGGIRPLNLTDREKNDLVAFMKALTSQELED